MKSTHTQVLLDEESLKRHFKFFNPRLINLIKFRISNKYNEDMNNNTIIGEDEKQENANLQQDIIAENLPHQTNAMDVVAKGTILGVIPKSNQIDNIIKKAKAANKNNNIKEIHIFSITDEFEQGLPGMLQPKELENDREDAIKFQHHQVPMTDFGAEITAQSVLAAVYQMRKIIEEGGIIYIHCKAGKARSAMIVATYLAIFGDEENLKINPTHSTHSPLKQAIDYLKSRRSQVDLHDDKVNDWNQLMKNKNNVNKLKKAQEAINLHHAISQELKIDGNKVGTINDYINKFNLCSKKNWKSMKWEKAPPIKSMKIFTREKSPWQFAAGESILSSWEFKNELIHFTSFKQLKIYATQSRNTFKPISKRTRYLKEFMKKIYEAKDDNWFQEWKNGTSPLTKLYANSKSSNELKELILGFIRDIEIYHHEKYIATIPKIPRDQIDEEKTTETLRESSRKPTHLSTEASVYKRLSKNNIDKAKEFAEHSTHISMHKKYSAEELQKHHGGIYVKLILDAVKLSQVPMDQIQFNFCLQSLPSDQKYIQRAINMHLDHNIEINPEDKAQLASLNLPFNASRLHSYGETLHFRGESFCEAAKLIIENSLHKDASADPLQKIQALFKHFDEQLNNTTMNKNQQQACYDAYLDTLKDILKQALNENDDKIISSYLKNAETINNIKSKRAHISFSGLVENAEEKLSGTIRLQIDKPLTQFKHLSHDQQQAWKEAIQVYLEQKNVTEPNRFYDNQKSVPEWFNRLPEFEKKIWVERLTKNNTLLSDEEIKNVDMGSVVKKEGLPGLRNLALSSFGILAYDDHDKLKTFVSNESVRSSNLVVQNKEKTAKLTNSEKNLTKMNVAQVDHVYKENKLEAKFNELWDLPTSTKPQKYKLCQTLLRKIGGGDDYVIGHKQDAINHVQSDYDDMPAHKKIDSDYYNLKVFASNHCIGAPNHLVHGIMHLANANTKTMDHVIQPVEHFYNAIVKRALNPYIFSSYGSSYGFLKKLDQLYEKAISGKLEPGIIEILNTHPVSDPVLQDIYLNKEKNSEDIVAKRIQQIDTIHRVLNAVNMYSQLNSKTSCYKKKYQLHMAALEEIIYQDTGNRVQSSCKSGKDREGIEKCYRNAMLAFFHQYHYLPPAKENSNGDRQKFIDIFVELFKTHHQARLAELNAHGCEGQKALFNILPQDILTVLCKDGNELLQAHAENSTLNDFGKSKVKADAKTYEEAREQYKNVIQGESEASGDQESVHLS